MVFNISRGLERRRQRQEEQRQLQQEQRRQDDLVELERRRQRQEEQRQLQQEQRRQDDLVELERERTRQREQKLELERERTRQQKQQKQSERDRARVQECQEQRAIEHTRQKNTESRFKAGAYAVAGVGMAYAAPYIIDGTVAALQCVAGVGVIGLVTAGVTWGAKAYMENQTHRHDRYVVSQERVMEMDCRSRDAAFNAALNVSREQGRQDHHRHMHHMYINAPPGRTSGSYLENIHS